MKKILLSVSILVFVGAIVVGATGAFFSDTETSTGNTFTAGSIDLQIDNESYAIDHNILGYPNPTGALVVSTSTSWTLRDLTIEKFFDFIDLKPGDFGEDTISIHVGSNDAWVCAVAQITEDIDNGCTEPEVEDNDPDCNDPGDEGGDGELDNELQFAFWVDDGDNVFETCEGVDASVVPVCQEESFFLYGPLSGLGIAGQIALADANGSILSENEPIPGGTEFYIGKAWCFGNLTEDPALQDGLGKTGSNGPLNPTRGTGIDCDGSQVGNIAQTDRVVGDLTFYAEQSRNNPDFQCQGN